MQFYKHYRLWKSTREYTRFDFWRKTRKTRRFTLACSYLWCIQRTSFDLWRHYYTLSNNSFWSVIKLILRVFYLLLEKILWFALRAFVFFPAAHCFYNFPEKKLYNTRNFEVVVSKYFHDYKQKDNSDTRVYKVSITENDFHVFVQRLTLITNMD